MPVTFAEYYASLPPIPPYGRVQRMLCGLGIHRGHRAYHAWDKGERLIGRFMEAMPELQNLPFRKIDGATYTYKAGAD